MDITFDIPYSEENIVLDPLSVIVEKMADLQDDGYSFSKENFLYALGVKDDYLFDDEDDFCWESLIVVLKSILSYGRTCSIESSWHEDWSDFDYYNLSCGHQYVSADGIAPKHCDICCAEVVTNDK